MQRTYWFVVTDAVQSIYGKDQLRNFISPSELSGELLDVQCIGTVN